MKLTRNFIIAFAAFTVLFLQGCASRRATTTPLATRNTALPAGTKPYFLFFSDVHLDTSSVSTGYGDDAGTALWGSALERLKTIVDSSQPPAFVLYTGDLPVHYSCGSGPDGCYLPDQPSWKGKLHDGGIRNMLSSFTQLVAKTNIPLLYLPGNNDAQAGDYYPFNIPNGSTPFSLMPGNGSAYPYDSFHVSRRPSPLGAYMLDVRMDAGYYAVKVMNGLRVISLNSVIFGPYFEGVSDAVHEQMARDQMDWLGSQLDSAASSGDKVYLAMHIPPGMDAYNGDSMWTSFKGGYAVQDSFIKYISKYSTSISGIFYGHTHLDELRLLYEKGANMPVQVAISSPGISVSHHNNPGFKLVSFDPGSKLPTDFTTSYSTYTATTWLNNCYSFSTIFPVQQSDTSMLQTLQRMKPQDVLSRVNKIYMVMSGAKGEDTMAALQVK